MSVWLFLLLLAGLVLHTMVLPIVREMRKEKERRKNLPPDYRPKVRPPEAFDEPDD
jgi:hypothetical protein